MHGTRLVFVALALPGVTLAACNPFHRDPVVAVSKDANLNTRWHAALATPAGLVGAVQINGSASMAPAENRDDTQLSLTLANATPGGVHPWQLHRGQCGSDEGLIGSDGQYKALKINDDGRASGSAIVPLETPTSGNYYVVVGASAANPETVVACGNLAPPTQ